MRAVLALLALLAAPASAGDLQVTVTGARPAGPIRLMLADSSAAFAARDGIRRAVLPPVGGQARVTLTDLVPGRYAIAVFQDLDGDGELGTLLGIPTEPYGFSNDAGGTVGPPGFDAAAFTMGKTAQAQEIRLR